MVTGCDVEEGQEKAHSRWAAVVTEGLYDCDFASGGVVEGEPDAEEVAGGFAIVVD